MRTLCIYTFHEMSERVRNVMDRIFFDDPTGDVRFMVVVCNPDLKIKLSCPNVEVVYRENGGYDMGGWSYGLLHENTYKDYDKFIFVNGSADGPYLRKGYGGRWTSILTDGVRDDVKVFGPTINTMNDPERWSHVQTYAFAMDRDALDLLIEKEVFSLEKMPRTKDEAILMEIAVSRHVIGHGWQIGCLLKRYADVDFRFKDRRPSSYGHLLERLREPDPMYQMYEGVEWTRTELMFIKGNRIRSEWDGVDKTVGMVAVGWMAYQISERIRRKVR